MNTAAAALIITLFGPAQVLINNQPIPAMRSRKGMWLLALLILRHNRPVEREWLAGTLWPDVDQSQAFANLRPILSELRSSLGQEGWRLQSPGKRTLMMNLDGAQVDVIQFDSAIESARESETASELERATALYKGPLLEGCFEQWALEEREQRESGCLLALQTLGENCLNAGDFTRAAAYFQRACSIDGWRDSARRGWMEALARSGDRNAALHVYREFVEFLRQDPTATPDEETRSLYARLRTEIRETPASVPPPAKEQANSRTPGYLPAPLTEIIGRDDEIWEVADRLRQNRLVTLTGLGGIGKTRLALEAAKSAAPDFADGVWMVALDSISEGELVAQQIATVLGVGQEQGLNLNESLTARLKDKRLLIILDNCEHLLNASATLAALLLRECPGVRVLATSREPLGITGESDWTVPSLPFPDPEHLPSTPTALLRVLSSYESVQMFAERAQAVQKTFALNENNAQAVARICSKLEGIPLAIEFAAARIKALTVEQTASRLDDYLGLLTSGSRTAQYRQQTLRATLDWSFALLSEAERILLRRVSIFSAGWTLEAAEQICCGDGLDASSVMDLMISLTDKSLVVFQDRGKAEGRYRLLEMVRQYAGEQLRSADETAAMKLRLRRWLVELAEQMDAHFTDSEQEIWQHRVDDEYGNIRATLADDEVVDDKGEETALRITGSMWRYWDIRGLYSEGCRHILRALEQQPELNTLPRGRSCTGMASLSYRQGDYPTTHQYQQRCLAIYRAMNYRRGIAALLANMGTVAYSQGKFTTARELLEESIEIHREIGNKYGIADTAQSLGYLTMVQSDLDAAQALFDESISLQREIGNTRGIGFALESLGNNALLRGEYQRSRDLFEESLRIRTEIGDKYGIALATGNLGLAVKELGEVDLSRSLLEESTEIFKEIGDIPSVAIGIVLLGTLARDRGELVHAKKQIEEGLTLSRQAGELYNIACGLTALALVCNELGDPAAGLPMVVESLNIRGTLLHRHGIAESLEAAAAILVPTDASKSALLWGAAQGLRDQIGSPMLPCDRNYYKAYMRRAQHFLGESAYTSAYNEGSKMNWREAAAKLKEFRSESP